MPLIRDLKSYGLQPRASDLVQFKIHGVTPEYLKGLKDAGYGSLPESQITELKIHGVSTDFMRQAGGLGYHFRAQDLTELRIHGVDAAYLKRLQDSGMRNLWVEQITKLKIHGGGLRQFEGEFCKVFVAEAGFRDPSDILRTSGNLAGLEGLLGLLVCSRKASQTAEKQ